MTSASNNPENSTTDTGAATVAPENNLALRYNYEQLDPYHRVIADRVTALIVAFPDITRLNDPAKQRQLIQEVMNSPIAQGAGAQAGALATEAGGLARQIPGLRDVMGAAETAGNVTQGAGNVLGAAAQGFGAVALPFTMTAEAAAEFHNQLKVIGNTMTPEQARSLGAAYASVFQARAAERQEKGFGAAFSSVDNFISYGSAGFAWIWDLVRQIPVIGDLLKKMDPQPTRSFDEHLRRAANGADIRVTREQLAEAGTIDGVDTRNWSELLTRGGEAQNRSGQDTNVAAPTKNDPVPLVPDAPKDDNGAPVVAPADAAAVTADAAAKAGAAAQRPLNESMQGIGGPATAAAFVAGSAVAVDGAVGVAQGAARQFVGERSVPVQRAANVTKQIVDLRATANQLREGNSGFRFWENDAAREVRATRLEARATELAAKPSNIRLAHVAEARADIGGRLGQFADDAAEQKSGILRIGRNVGRWVGDLGGGALERVAHMGSSVVGRIPVIGTRLVEAAPAFGGVIARVGARATPVLAVAAPVIDTVDLGAGIVNHDNRQITTAGTRLGTVVAGAGIGATWGLLGGPLAPATVPAGAIAGAAIGGIASIFTGWGAGKVYDRYNRPVDASPVAPQTNASGALGAADADLTQANVDQQAATQRAQAQARQANLTSQVAGVGTVPQGEDKPFSLSSFKFGNMHVGRNGIDLNPFS